MAPELIKVDRQDEAIIITLNRPEKRNCYNLALLHAIQVEVDRVRFDRKTRVIVITGAGEKAFCAGVDLKERATLSEEQVKAFLHTANSLLISLETLRQPVIAGINGLALGGGTEMCLACDIRLSSSTAVMGLPETRLAVIPGTGGTQRLPRIVGLGIAKELIFTGRRVDAEEALRIGLVNKVCPPDKLMDECIAMANMISETGPIAIQQAKHAVNHGIETDLHTGLAIESNAYWITMPTQDRLEALVAFKEKRKPVFEGK